MRIILTFLWTLALVSLLNYVTGAIAGVALFNFSAGAIIAVFATVLIIIIGESFPEGPIADH